MRGVLDKCFGRNAFLILKDVHGELNNPKIIALLKRIADNTMEKEALNATVFIISEITVIPPELKNYITVFDMPLPSTSEIQTIIKAYARDLEIEVDSDTVNDLAVSFKWLNEFQINQILNLAYQDGGCIDKDDRLLISKEKEQLVKKSGMLEIVNFIVPIRRIF